MYVTSRGTDIGKNKQYVLHFGNLHNRLQMKLCRIDFFVSFLQNWELYLLGQIPHPCRWSNPQGNPNPFFVEAEPKPFKTASFGPRLARVDLIMKASDEVNRNEQLAWNNSFHGDTSFASKVQGPIRNNLRAIKQQMCDLMVRYQIKYRELKSCDRHVGADFKFFKVANLRFQLTQ